MTTIPQDFAKQLMVFLDDLLGYNSTGTQAFTQKIKPSEAEMLRKAHALCITIVTATEEAIHHINQLPEVGQQLAAAWWKRVCSRLTECILRTILALIDVGHHILEEVELVFVAIAQEIDGLRCYFTGRWRADGHSAWNIANTLYALANAHNINYEHPYTWPGLTLRWLPFEQQSNPRLADSIALLPLTESASDVAAVELEYRPKEITIYYSKNRPRARLD